MTVGIDLEREVEDLRQLLDRREPPLELLTRGDVAVRVVEPDLAPGLQQTLHAARGARGAADMQKQRCVSWIRHIHILQPERTFFN